MKTVGAGTATITCTSNATGAKATCELTVKTAVTRSLVEDDDELKDIEDMGTDPTDTEPFDVYDLSGRKVLHQVTSMEGLSRGIYIVKGKKVVKK